MKKIIMSVLITLCPFFLFSQQYDNDLLKKNENLIFSFKLSNGKTCSIIQGNDGEYLIYRFGKSDKIELEYPKINDEKSWSNFTYSYYFRGGADEGMDLNNLYFINNNFKYLVFDEYISSDNAETYGIKIINLDNNKEYELNGLKNTKKGSLIFFRDNEKIKKEDFN